MKLKRPAHARWFGLAVVASAVQDEQASVVPLFAAPQPDATALLQTAVGVSDLQPQAPSEILASGEFGNTVRPDQQVLQNFGDAQYVAYMTVGRQIITAILDTGSSDFVVFGADCQSCGAAAHYSSRFSKTYSPGHVLMQQHFGSGNTVSIFSKEQMSIGPFKLASQAFWNVEEADMSVLSSAAFEAIIGMGPPHAPSAKAWKTASDAVDEVVQIYERAEREATEEMQEAQAKIHAAVEITGHPPILASANVTAFSVCMGAAPGSDGLFTWNDAVAAEQPHLFTKVPVEGDTAWTAALRNWSLVLSDKGEAPLSGGSNGSASAILDTGSSVLGVPTEVFASISKAMEGLDEECSNVHVLPNLVFHLGGAEFSLPPDAYVAKVTGSMPEFLQKRAQEPQPEGEEHRERQCQLMLVETNATNTESPSWVLGVPFFRKYYTTFHLGSRPADRSFSIAPHGAEDCTPMPQAEVPLLQAQPSQLRRVSAERIRLSTTAHRALTTRSRP